MFPPNFLTLPSHCLPYFPKVWPNDPENGEQGTNWKVPSPSSKQTMDLREKIFLGFFFVQFFWYMKFPNPYKNQNPNDYSLTPLRSAMARGVSTNSFQTEVPGGWGKEDSRPTSKGPTELVHLPKCQAISASNVFLLGWNQNTVVW